MISIQYFAASNALFTRLKHTAIICLAISLSACAPHTHEIAYTGKTTVEHIVLVSIDGLRPDAINANNAPHLYQLTQTGLYYPNAQTIQRSVTLPSHASMLTGLDSMHHKIDKNKSLAGYLTFPTVLKMLKEDGQSTAAFFSKKKLNFLFPPDSIDYIYARGQNGIDSQQTTAHQLASEFARNWDKNAFNLTFIHIREPDMAGHRHGWMSDAYLNQAVPIADQAIGQIHSSIKNSRYANNTLLIITADHGGKDKIHWGNRQEDLTIPWLAVFPHMKAVTHREENVSIYDTTPTILYLLGTAIPTGLDGQVIPGIQALFPVSDKTVSH